MSEKKNEKLKEYNFEDMVEAIKRTDYKVINDNLDIPITNYKLSEDDKMITLYALGIYATNFDDLEGSYKNFYPVGIFNVDTVYYLHLIYLDNNMMPHLSTESMYMIYSTNIYTINDFETGGIVCLWKSDGSYKEYLTKKEIHKLMMDKTKKIGKIITNSLYPSFPYQLQYPSFPYKVPNTFDYSRLYNQDNQDEHFMDIMERCSDNVYDMYNELINPKPNQRKRGPDGRFIKNNI